MFAATTTPSRSGRIARALAVAIALLLPPLAAQAEAIRSSVDAAALPQKKQTPLGLYLTPADAHAALRADPSILFLDVRDPIEISFVGRAEGMDANVPLALATHRFNADSGRYAMVSNPDFVAQTEAVASRLNLAKDAPVFVMCRSGVRSAAAAAALSKAGYTNVWNIVEGFEGDMNRATGRRSVNGWKNAGLPWTYKLPTEGAWIQPKTCAEGQGGAC